tara:strand:- start:9362 stop:9697 length:336 start_codon:yes stop_codon:yes gene_type:complete
MVNFFNNKLILAEILATIAGMLSLIAYIPQTYKVYLTNQTDDLEINTFFLLFIIQLIWALWGALLGSMSIITFSILQIIFIGYIILKIYKNNKDNKHIHIHNHNNLYSFLN